MAKKKRLNLKKAKERRARAPTPVKKHTVDGYDGVVCSSRDLVLRYLMIILHGLTGAGKTFMALTASKYHKGFPVPKSERPRVYKDMLWISADSDATDGFTSQGIEVPEISLIKLMSDPETWTTAGFSAAPSIIEAVGYAVGRAGERVQSGQTTWVVLDTPSSIDDDSVAFYDERSGGDGRALYRMNLSFHRMIIRELRFAGAKIICCMHTEAASNTFGGNQDAKDAVMTTHSGKFKIAVSGKSALMYKKHASLQFYIEERRIPNTKRSERIAHTAIGEGETKNRFQDCLTAEEPADIGKALAKIARKIGRKR